MTSKFKTPEHRIASVKYSLERLECVCGTVMTAERDAFTPQAHRPLVASWEAHRRATSRRPSATDHGRDREP